MRHRELISPAPDALLFSFGNEASPMNVSSKCPSCGFRFQFEERYLGRTARCPAPECRQTMLLKAVSVPSRSRRSNLVDSKHRRKRAALRSRTRSAALKRRRNRLPKSIVSVVLAAAGIATVAFFLWNRSSSDVVAAGVPLTASQPSGTSPILVSLPQTTTEQIEKEDAARSQKLQARLVPFLNKYCVDCHGADEPMAGIAVHDLSGVEQLRAKRKSWERVYRMINAGAMPPLDHDPRPDVKELQAAAELLHDELYNFDCDLVRNAGRSTIQRLNKAEYNNTIRDLLGVEITPADDFPADDVGEGFDNIGDVLSLPPLLMEKYLNAAEQVARAVVDTTDYSRPQTVTVSAEKTRAQGGGGNLSGDSRWLSSHGVIFADFDVRADGEYEVRMEVLGDQYGDEKVRFALTVADLPPAEFSVKSHRKPERFQQKVRLTAGKTAVGLRFLNDFYVAQKGDRNFAVRKIELHGPLSGAVPQYAEVHRRFVTARPGDSVSVHEAAVQVLRPLMQRAFRRPVSDAEVNRYAGLVDATVSDMGETYEQALSLALQAVLVAPDFLFRMESEPEHGEPERLLNDFEVATRLSYFLWSSMPDAELFALAEQNELKKPAVLRQQITRMLQHPRAHALVQNFAAQWLNLRNLDDVTPNTDVYQGFTEELRRDMRHETELLFQTILNEDRSVADLLSADFTFVNGRLAEHYGIRGVTGDEFVRVSLQGTNRVGVLTHASVLTLTSNPGRTSPVKRGKWIMENLFGEAPPPPPPDIPTLEETAKVSPGATLREQLAKHREDPGCASCHNTMDVLGLGFENYDGIGQWRTMDEGRPVDASGVLPTGETFDGPLQLVEIIRNRRDKFLRTLTEKLLVYAIGRGTEYYDKCTVDDCLKLMEQRGHRFSSLVEGIVLSDPFLKRHRIEAKTADRAVPASRQ